MAALARWNVTSRISVSHQLSAKREHGLADDRGNWRGKRLALRSEIVRNILEIIVGEEFKKVVHRRVASTSYFECKKLTVQIAGWLAAETWNVSILGPLSPFAMTSCAGLNARSDRIANGRLRVRIVT